MSKLLPIKAKNITKDDLEIKFDENLVFSDYEKVNPQTKVLIEKFELDDRLF